MEEVAYVQGGYKPINTKNKINDVILNGKSLVKNKIVDLTNVVTIDMTEAAAAIAGAEKCNITMTDSAVTITDRNGKESVIDIAMQSETVNLTITSDEPSVKVAEIKLSVYINGGKTPTYYTTDNNGKVTFTVPRGNYYQIEFPEYAKAQPISPIGYTAILNSRDIDVKYLPYDEATSEKVIIKVNKVKDSTKTAWADKEVKITVDEKTTSYTTNTDGEYIIWIPLGKEYTIQVDDSDGYYVNFSRNKRTFTAKVVQRQVVYNAGIYLTGIFLLNNQGEQYNIDDWKKLGYTGDDVVGIRISTDILMTNRSSYVIPMKVLLEHKSISYQWCNQNVLFESISSNSNNTSDIYYYDGEGANELIRDEAQSKALLVPAFTYAYSQILEINGEQYHGFIGSIAQWTACINNMSYIRDNIITELWDADTASTIYKWIVNNWKWTSCQNNTNAAWSYNTNAGSYYKTNSGLTIPFYAS